MEELFKKYLNNLCSPEEVGILMTYFNNPENEVTLRALIADSLDAVETEDDESQWQPATDRIFAQIKIQQQSGRGKIVPLFRRNWIRIAASVILVVGIFNIFNYYNRTGPVNQEMAETKKISAEVGPGGNKAILTLDKGETILLNAAVSDTIAKQGNTTITKFADGQLLYRSDNEKPTNTLYNSIATPRGGQYQLTLSEGTRVWLNAASSIHFPVVFTGTERKVEITGEVYFEVAQNKSMPFKVKIADKAEIEVLGTHFNVNAYSDESTINTSLLEGKVKFTSLIQNVSRIIVPGEQAELNASNQIKVNKQADIEQAIAWKNGIFQFQNANLQTALRQLARWYNVDIVFEGSIPDKQFSGEMQRSLNLSQVIKLLEKSDVHCRLDPGDTSGNGKKLIVLN